MNQSEIHPMAPENLPLFIPAADGSDPVSTGLAIFGIVMIVVIGVFYFRLHAIPEHLAHEAGHTQIQVVGILALLALFTHNNIFWIIALLLAAFKMPDFLSPIQSIARSLQNMQTQVANDAAQVTDKPEEEQ